LGENKNVTKNFIGNKIKITDILNRDIIVHYYKIEDSKIFKGGKCLYAQVSVDETKRIIFTSSSGLVKKIQQINKNNFPFRTKIVENNKKFEFV
jgi:hypothetical protein